MDDDRVRQLRLSLAVTYKQSKQEHYLVCWLRYVFGLKHEAEINFCGYSFRIKIISCLEGNPLTDGNFPNYYDRSQIIEIFLSRPIFGRKIKL